MIQKAEQDNGLRVTDDWTLNDEIGQAASAFNTMRMRFRPNDGPSSSGVPT